MNSHVYLMSRKSEAFEKFKEFRDQAETIRCVHKGPLVWSRWQILPRDFKDHLSKAEIVSRLTIPGTLQKNVAERRNRTLLEMVRAMMNYVTLPMYFWGYALDTAAHILNKVPSKFVPKTPLALCTRRKLSIRYIHIWGCPAHVLKGKSNKLESKTEVCLFDG